MVCRSPFCTALVRFGVNVKLDSRKELEIVPSLSVLGKSVEDCILAIFAALKSHLGLLSSTPAPWHTAWRQQQKASRLSVSRVLGLLSFSALCLVSSAACLYTLSSALVT